MDAQGNHGLNRPCVAQPDHLPGQRRTGRLHLDQRLAGRFEQLGHPAAAARPGRRRCRCCRRPAAPGPTARCPARWRTRPGAAPARRTTGPAERPYGVMSMPSAGTPRSASATVSRPGPEPTSRVGPGQRSRMDRSPGMTCSQSSIRSGVRRPSACSISGRARPARASSYSSPSTRSPSFRFVRQRTRDRPGSPGSAPGGRRTQRAHQGAARRGHGGDELNGGRAETTLTDL